MFTVVEPFSGIVLEQKSSLSYFIYLENNIALPFPSLDMIGSQLIPVFDMEVSMVVDTDKFNSDFGFVQTGNTNKQGILIAFIVLTVVFFLLGLVGTIVYCMKKG